MPSARRGGTQHHAQKIHAMLERPNLYADVSRRLIAAGFLNSRWREMNSVQNNIMGTSLRGTTPMHRQSRRQIPANADHAVLNISLAGRAMSNTVGRNGPVTVYRSGIRCGIGPVNESHSQCVGVFGDKAVADVSTNSNINRISRNMRPGQRHRLEPGSANQNRRQAEQIASSKRNGGWQGNSNVTVVNDRSGQRSTAGEVFRCASAT